MSYIPAIDVSQYQGAINWATISEPIAIIKVSGGDAGLYFDSKANANYYGAKAAGKHVGCYHFAGGGDPATEAEYFLKAMTPLVAGDVAALDFEISHADPVGWCNSFVDRFKSQAGFYPLLYINLAMLNAHDWSPVLSKCGLWIAAWNNNPDGPAVTEKAYVMHQYADAPWCDHDAWFGSLEQFDKYGFQAPAPAAPTPVTPAPETPPTPEPQPVVVNDPLPPVPPAVPTPVENPPVPVPTPIEVENNSLLKQILALLQGLADKFTNIFK